MTSNTQYSDIFVQWKSELNSGCFKSHVKALSEIILTIDTADESEKEKIIKILLNRDICHFICQLLSFSSLKKTPFINKIVAQLSESPKFFISEVFKVLKGYFRLLNTLPSVGGNLIQRVRTTKCNKQIEDIFTCVSLVIIR